MFLDDALAGEDRGERISKLAEELRYMNAKSVEMWTTGASKVPLRMLSPLSVHIGCDVSDLLPLWIAQEMASDDEDRLYTAAKRILSAWEWGLISVARDIYRGDDIVEEL